MKHALIVWGGWEGHEPEVVALRFASELKKCNITSDISPTLNCLDDGNKLKSYNLIIPTWSMGTLTDAQSKNLLDAVRAGTGFAGVHGGAGDAFRGNLDYEWMVGGHFVGHPHVGEYTVRLTAEQSPITAPLPEEFTYQSEQYYMLVDPGVRVLAETLYLHEGQRIPMPVAWTKTWGKGRVFYSSLGHAPKEFDDFPHVLEMTIRGFMWAAESL